MITFEVDDIRDMNAELAQFLRYLKSFGVDEDAVFDSRLISCELITNVLRHCGGSACFSGVFDNGEIVISVRAENPSGKICVPDLPSALAEGGRGLYIVNAISGGNVIISGGDVTVKLIVKGN
ncbi:MAG: ATP-binding protein [Clostridiales bacterium]|nr:ATP-binding protein [Clostridiales bacterium]